MGSIRALMVQDIQHIWDDEHAGHGQEDEEDMDDFIDYEDEEEAGGLDEQEWEERWCKRNCRGSVGGSWVLYPSYLESMLAMHPNHALDGHEYDWALAGDNEVELDKEAQKPEMKYQDSSTLSLHQNLTESDIDDAAAWVTSCTPKVDAVEMVADSIEWLSMKYKSRKQDTFDLHFHDDEERSVISKLVKGFGIWPHKVIQNFISLDRPNIVEDQELNLPLSQNKLLHHAQMILATELGKDPLLRQMIHELFNIEAQISV
ncbi:hypothetical protein F5141DRAFT_1065262 [Pisolithus sp. B1]|nr:hypothetical protein F5141DRAFT_1065262 [Pisolithus sp. B1]